MEKEVSELDRKLEVKRKYLEQVHYALTKDSLDQRDLYSIVRNFFTDFLKLEYEFTYEELVQELNKIFVKPADKKSIDEFLISLSESEYLEERDLEQQEIKDYLQRLLTIIESLITNVTVEQKKATFIEKILGRKPQEAQEKSSGQAANAKAADTTGSKDRDENNAEKLRQENIISAITKREAVLKDQIISQTASVADMPMMPSMDDISSGPQNAIMMPLPMEESMPSDIADVAKENSHIKQDMFKGYDRVMPELDKPKKSNDKKSNDNKSDVKQGLMDNSKDKRLKPKKQKNTDDETDGSENVLLISDDNGSPDMQPVNATKMPVGSIRQGDKLEIEDDNPRIQEVNKMLEKSYLSISTGNLDGAKAGYLKALGLYHNLEYKEKIKIYFRLYDLYMKLKTL